MNAIAWAIAYAGLMIGCGLLGPDAYSKMTEGQKQTAAIMSLWLMIGLTMSSFR